PPLDGPDEAAEAADRPVGRHAAALARIRLLPVDLRERRLGGAEELLHEGELRARARVLEPVERLLVDELGRSGRVRTLLDDVVDPAHERVHRGLVLAHEVERLHLADEPRMRRRKDGALAREMVLLPAEHVAHEPRRLVVEVVTRHEDVEAAVDGRLVEEVPLHRSARRAGDPARGGGDRGDGEPALLGGEGHDAERKPAARREGHDLLVRHVGVRADAEADVEPGRVVAEIGEHVPEREAVLPAGDGDEEPVALLEHPLVRDRALDLTGEEEEEARAAEAGVVRPQLDFGLRPAARAPHAAPPEMTARISISSASSTTSPPVRRTSSRMTIAVPGRIPSSARSAATRRRPASSTVRCWGRRWTRMAGS